MKQTSIEKLLTSLGEPVDGNEYEIKNHNGEWWIDHKAIGSGEPLSQWLGKYIPQQEISDEKNGKPYDWYNEDYAMEQFRKQLKQRKWG
jgi:hypothetical protein